MPAMQEIKRESKFYDAFPNCRIRERIEKGLKLSYKEAAAVLNKAGIAGVSHEAVRQWCGGYSRPDMGKLIDIAAALGCSINYLFGVDEYPDMEISDISRKTGLSEDTIKTIETYSGREMSLLNDLVTDSRFRAALSCWEDAVLAALSTPAPNKVHAGPAATPFVVPALEPGYYTVAGKVASEFFLQMAMENIKSIIKEKTSNIVKSAKEEGGAYGND